MRYWLVMPAAGSGSRFGASAPKQYADLHGRALIEWSLAPFLTDTRCVGAVVVISSGDTWWPTVAPRLTTGGVTKVLTAPGGAERCESVLNGLRVLESRMAGEEWVLVHDAARPCVSCDDRDRLLESAGRHLIGGLLAVPAADTLKRADAQRLVVQTVDRSDLWRALTPQMFRAQRLREGLERALAAGRSPTDEAQAIEWLGDQPLVVPGSSTNIKVTTADDLSIASAVLAARISGPDEVRQA